MVWSTSPTSTLSIQHVDGTTTGSVACTRDYKADSWMKFIQTITFVSADKRDPDSELLAHDGMLKSFRIALQRAVLQPHRARVLNQHADE